MPVTELIGELEKTRGLTVNQAHKVLRECNLPQSGDITDADRDRVLAHVDNPKPKDLAPKPKAQDQEKGQLTKAHESVGKAAIQSTKRQMVAVADKAAREGAVAYATRSAQNLQTLAVEIAGMTDTAMQVYDTVEGEEDDDPLALPPLSFGLT
jgi:hypothetical protein